MVSQTNEAALEDAIERALTGGAVGGASFGECNEATEGFDHPYPAPRNRGYVIGKSENFDKHFAVDTQFFWAFLERTQPKELAKLERSGGDWQRRMLERLDRFVKKHGLLHVLKKPLKIDDASLTLFYAKPGPGDAQAAQDNYAQNIFSCTRQLHYNAVKPNESVDIVLFLNGLPFATLELKNAWTHQTARRDGQKQYREDRDTSQTLFNFARCLVHMAVDTDEVWMTTKLARAATYFLPFNKGDGEGAGNPVNPHGHRTAYLWNEVLTRDSVANIIQHFVRLDGKSSDPIGKRTLFFPRYQQLDVVRKLVADTERSGAGQTYLIQHSAGSGKSNSITWLAYQLIETYKAGEPDSPIFDSVVVVTDRRLLDKQIGDNIRSFSEVKNIVARPDTSAKLQEAMEAGKKVIITTIQKFPFIVKEISDLSDKRFAVIIDEAHSSQSGRSHDEMNSALGGRADAEDGAEETDAQDLIVQSMQARKQRKNASYYAFTATPKNTTLEKFGTQQADGSFRPFHLYSMRQAIEEGFILDVLANYTTYRSYYQIQKSIEDNPIFDTVKAQKKLRAYVEQNPETIATKAEIMLDHFTKNVIGKKRLKGQARGMIITQNIESAYRYYRAINALLKERGNPFRALISFSGSKTIDGHDYTEAELNGFPEGKTKQMFDGHDEDGKPIVRGGENLANTYRLLIVANKYLTGFDQPKLSAMYVDKKLQGVLCVQALSRLNRSAPKLGKRTEDLFVLDFFNKSEDIKTAFDGFYTSTSLSEATDVNVLHELKDELDAVGVYEWSEVEAFVEAYFKGADAQALSPIIDRAAKRFVAELELSENQKADFKIKAKQFVKIYGQMASIMPFEVLEWEKLFWFCKFLIPKLKIENEGEDELDALLESVDLSSYGLQRVRLGQSIILDEDETELDPQNPNPRSVHDDDTVRDPLDAIIDSFNERFFEGWDATPEEQRVKLLQLGERMVAHPDFKEKVENNPDEANRELALKKIYNDVKMDSRRQEVDFYKYVARDETNDKSVFNHLVELVDIRQREYQKTQVLDQDIDRIERKLRELITEREVHINPKIAENIDSRMAVDAKNDPSLRDPFSVGLEKKLSYCDFRELENIIVTKANWPEFDPVFGNKTTFSSRADQLAKLRNAIRHSRDISTPILFDGKAAIAWFNDFLWPKSTAA